ncbi:MAG: hypothetical protein GY868_19880, partial [Deltaproteobacteria bacterium]|nr:hypothetical protein [Deltaproteobacteria bacterium]
YALLSFQHPALSTQDSALSYGFTQASSRLAGKSQIAKLKKTNKFKNPIFKAVKQHSALNQPSAQQLTSF